MRNRSSGSGSRRSMTPTVCECRDGSLGFGCDAIVVPRPPGNVGLIQDQLYPPRDVDSVASTRQGGLGRLRPHDEDAPRDCPGVLALRVVRASQEPRSAAALSEHHPARAALLARSVVLLPGEALPDPSRDCLAVDPELPKGLPQLGFGFCHDLLGSRLTPGDRIEPRLQVRRRLVAGDRRRVDDERLHNRATALRGPDPPPADVPAGVQLLPDLVAGGVFSPPPPPPPPPPGGPAFF